MLIEISIFVLVLVFIIGIVVGWVFFPEPVWFRKFWQDRGFARWTR